MVERRRALSPSEVATPLRKPVSYASYHFRVLAQAGVITLAEEVNTGCSVKHFYELTPAISGLPWLPDALGLALDPAK